MRLSRLFITTLREDPAEAEVISHRLMLRAGMIKQLAAGIFTWQPLGWRSIRKIEQIVREEMDASGAAEVFLPAIHPAELWEASGRWALYGPELLRLTDRHNRPYCVGPTHEEVVTDLVASNVTSWRQLPVNLYQIQTKFRDEIRPRHGLMRAREFIMKDAYSFDRDADGAHASYQQMRLAYSNIFDRIGLNYRIVPADSGAIGGNLSEEFLVLADTGEAMIGEAGDYAANLERVPCVGLEGGRPEPGEPMAEIDTPGVSTIEELQDFLPERLPYERCVKTMLVTGEAGMAAVLLAGNDTLNLAKASVVDAIGAGARMAEPAEAAQAVGASFGSLGPVNMPLPVIADLALANSHDMACGANKDGRHLLNMNFGRDCSEPQFADLRFAKEGDVAPNGEKVSISRGIEIGHIFYLGTKYSKALGADFENSEGNSAAIEMGCYGIGVTRILAAAVEQNHDGAGMILPEAIAPFAVVVLPLGNGEVAKTAELVYGQLLDAGVDVALDDRGMRAGAAFADLDLLGIPNRLVISKRSLASSQTELKRRSEPEPEMLGLDEVVSRFASQPS